jgi:acyl carrier protein
MQVSELNTRLEALFRKVFRKPDLNLTRELTAQDVTGWDSITNTELLAEVENQFGIRFTLKEVRQMRNVGDLMDLLAARLGAA